MRNRPKRHPTPSLANEPTNTGQSRQDSENVDPPAVSKKKDKSLNETISGEVVRESILLETQQCKTNPRHDLSGTAIHVCLHVLGWWWTRWVEVDWHIYMAVPWSVVDCPPKATNSSGPASAMTRTAEVRAHRREFNSISAFSYCFDARSRWNRIIVAVVGVRARVGVGVGAAAVVGVIVGVTVGVAVAVAEAMSSDQCS